MPVSNCGDGSVGWQGDGGVWRWNEKNKVEGRKKGKEKKERTNARLED